MPATGGTPTLVRRNAGDGVYSPDGKRLAYVSPVIGRDPALYQRASTAEHLEPCSAGKTQAGCGGLLTLRGSPTRSKTASYVLTVASGSTSKVAEGGGNPQWMDDHTLVVGNATN